MSQRPAATPRSRPRHEAAADGIYSIGSVASALGVPVATLRTWEERYGVIAPERTLTGHRLYTRDQVEQLRFVVAELASGISAADAHRSLAQRMLIAPPAKSPDRRPWASILVAAREEYGAERIEFLLRTEGVAVEVALHLEQALNGFELRRPDLVIIELMIDGGSGELLCRRVKERSATPVLVISSLNTPDRARTAGADGFLLTPVGHLELATAVGELLGGGVMPRRLRAPYG